MAHRVRMGVISDVSMGCKIRKHYIVGDAIKEG